MFLCSYVYYFRDESFLIWRFNVKFVAHYPNQRNDYMLIGVPKWPISSQFFLYVSYVLINSGLQSSFSLSHVCSFAIRAFNFIDHIAVWELIEKIFVSFNKKIECIWDGVWDLAIYFMGQWFNNFWDLKYIRYCEKLIVTIHETELSTLVLYFCNRCVWHRHLAWFLSSFLY